MSVGVGALDDPNIVGDDILGVPFIKISLRFARTCNARPYRFGGFFNLMPVGEHSICSRKRKGGYGIRPYGFVRDLTF